MWPIIWYDLFDHVTNHMIFFTFQFRLVVKTAMKLLLVFVEYTESNSLLLLAAVYIVDKENGRLFTNFTFSSSFVSEIFFGSFIKTFSS